LFLLLLLLLPLLMLLLLPPAKDSSRDRWLLLQLDELCRCCRRGRVDNIRIQLGQQD